MPHSSVSRDFGFTLTESLIVVAIGGILVAMAIPSTIAAINRAKLAQATELTFHVKSEAQCGRGLEQRETFGDIVEKNYIAQVKTMLEWWTKNFASCQLGDERLSNRALWSGKALSQNFGSAMSEIFKSANELKRTYEFLPTARPILAR